MMQFVDFEKHWKEMLRSPEFPQHQEFLKDANLWSDLLPEIHFVLKEELRLLEFACMKTQGSAQECLLEAYRHSYEHRLQVDAIAEVFSLAEKPRSETEIFQSFILHSLENSEPISFLGPHYHLHSFCFEFLRNAKPRFAFFRLKRREEQSWRRLYEQCWQRLSSREKELILESLDASFKLFEHLLRSLRQGERSRKRKTIDQISQLETPPFFHERRAILTAWI